MNGAPSQVLLLIAHSCSQKIQGSWCVRIHPMEPPSLESLESTLCQWEDSSGRSKVINRSTQLRKYPVTIADHNGKSSRKISQRKNESCMGNFQLHRRRIALPKHLAPLLGETWNRPTRNQLSHGKKKNTLTFHKKLVAYIEILIMAYYNPLIPAYPIYSK